VDTAKIIDELTFLKCLPVEALRAADADRAAMIPLFVGAIERYLGAKDHHEREENLIFFIFHLLGSWREKSAYRFLVRLLRQPDIDDILGDGVISTSHRVIAAVFDGDPQPLYDLILDEYANEFVRSRMCEVLAMVTLSGELPRAQTAQFLQTCFDDLRPTHDCFVWSGWQSAIAMLGLAELKPLVKQAFERGSLSLMWLHHEDFEQDLDYAIRNPSSPVNGAKDEYTLFGDTISELSTWYSFSEKCEAEWRRIEAERLRGENEPGRVLWQPYEGPAINPFRDVGRNDPCPCGSGKKFKKCCLNASFELRADAA
jgi:hypothetical protein